MVLKIIVQNISYLSLNSLLLEIILFTYSPLAVVQQLPNVFDVKLVRIMNLTGFYTRLKATFEEQYCGKCAILVEKCMTLA